MPHIPNQPRHPRHASTATSHYIPGGWRDHHVASVSKSDVDPGIVAKELKAEANGSNAKTGTTAVIVVLGVLFAYSVFYRG